VAKSKILFSHAIIFIISTPVVVWAIVRARHETVNNCFKRFECMNRVFQHDISKHQAFFTAVAVITQVAITNNASELARLQNVLADEKSNGACRLKDNIIANRILRLRDALQDQCLLLPLYKTN